MLKFCLFAALALLAPEPKTITGKVVSIADGDTLTVLDDAKVQHKIRLHGIDAPKKVQPFGTKARESLAAKVFGKIVRVEVVDVDRYRREVGRIYLGLRFINLEMVRDGIAWRFVRYDRRANSPTLSARPERNTADFGRTRSRSRRRSSGGPHRLGPESKRPCQPAGPQQIDAQLEFGQVFALAVALPPGPGKSERT
jgi:endonuclease YncB( thermonuclease family)